MRAENSLAAVLWPPEIRIDLVLKTKSRATIPTFCFVGICACPGLITGSVSGALDDFSGPILSVLGGCHPRSPFPPAGLSSKSWGGLSANLTSGLFQARYPPTISKHYATHRY